MSNIYDEITSKIIEQLQAGTAPWHKPWAHPNPSVSFQLPINGVTGNRYNGINIPLLWSVADDKAFTTNQYATYKQWESKSEQVKKGEKGSMIVYFDHIEKEKENEEIEKIPFLKKSIVFNRCQLQSYVPAEPIEHTPSLIERLDHVETFIQNTGARITHDGGNRAYYNRVSDDIHLPEPEMFVGTPTQTPVESLYAVTMHEIGHWTGAPTRLNREFGKRFGDRKYAAEELVAEMTSAFACSYLQISGSPSPNHASYLANWMDRLDLIKTLQADNKMIITAASSASKALDYLVGLQPIIVSEELVKQHSGAVPEAGVVPGAEVRMKTTFGDQLRLF